jgi:hypothetical protein
MERCLCFEEPTPPLASGMQFFSMNSRFLRYERMWVISVMAVFLILSLQIVWLACKRVYKRRKQRLEEGFLRNRETVTLN